MPSGDLGLLTAAASTLLLNLPEDSLHCLCSHPRTLHNYFPPIFLKMKFTVITHQPALEDLEPYGQVRTKPGSTGEHLELGSGSLNAGFPLWVRGSTKKPH